MIGTNASTTCLTYYKNANSNFISYRVIKIYSFVQNENIKVIKVS